MQDRTDKKITSRSGTVFFLSSAVVRPDEMREPAVRIMTAVRRRWNLSPFAAGGRADVRARA